MKAMLPAQAETDVVGALTLMALDPASAIVGSAQFHADPNRHRIRVGPRDRVRRRRPADAAKKRLNELMRAGPLPGAACAPEWNPEGTCAS
jgi:hypothetical protein